MDARQIKELLRRRAHLEESMERIMVEGVKSDTRAILIMRSLVFLVFLGGALWAMLALLIYSFCDFDIPASIKIAGCFYLLYALPVWLITRKLAHTEAIKIAKHRCRMCRKEIKRINSKLAGLDFISLEPEDL